MILKASVLAECQTEGAADYDFDKECFEVAEEKGLRVVFPEANQLQIDLDTTEAYEEFQKRFERWEWKKTHGGPPGMRVMPSVSGLPHLHVTLTFEDRKFTEVERILLQTALGSDPTREFLNAMRYFSGVKKPTRLFERKPLNESKV